MNKLKEGDRVRPTKKCMETNSYWGLKRDKVYIVEHHFGVLVIFNRPPNTNGWITEAMGLHELFELANPIRIGGE